MGGYVYACRKIPRRLKRYEALDIWHLGTSKQIEFAICVYYICPVLILCLRPPVACAGSTLCPLMQSMDLGFFPTFLCRTGNRSQQVTGHKWGLFLCPDVKDVNMLMHSAQYTELNRWYPCLVLGNNSLLPSPQEVHQQPQEGKMGRFSPLE